VKKLFMLILIVFLIGGCATKNIYQVDGYAVPNNVISTSIISIQIKINYNLTHYFSVKEDDESYESYEFLAFFPEQIHSLDGDPKVVFNLSIFNPYKNQYKIVKTTLVEGHPNDNETVYKGNISRNQFSFVLPVIKSKLVHFYYSVYDKDDNLLLESFKVRYIIEG